ncbi:MAG TPA: FAD-binding protein [Thermoleophilaceae bacterium]
MPESIVGGVGFTIVPEDEACFCQFEGPSEAAVAEANRRAGLVFLVFDRIVPAVAVSPGRRAQTMSSVTAVDPVQQLREAFSGQILSPGEPGYDEARRIHNGLIDKHPAVIARCHHTADVVDAVNFGRDAGREISIRGGGHNVAGKAVTDGGLMIDLPDKGHPRRPSATGGPRAARRHRRRARPDHGRLRLATRAASCPPPGSRVSRSAAVSLG